MTKLAYEWPLVGGWFCPFLSTLLEIILMALMAFDTNQHPDDVLREVSRRAQLLCEAAQVSGYTAIHEGCVWLSTRRHLEQEAGGIYQRRDFSPAEFWIELCEAEPIPVQGPDDPELMYFLID